MYKRQAYPLLLFLFTNPHPHPHPKGMAPMATFRTEVFQNEFLPDGGTDAVSYTHLRAHETVLDLVCRLLLEKKKQLAHLLLSS